MELLKIENLSKNFYLHNLGKVIHSCENVSFSLEKGQFAGIIGRSGAGKSTILKCINRTYLPLRGEILYDSERFGLVNLAEASDREMLYLRKYEIGNVSQFLNVMPRTTAKEHVAGALLEMGENAAHAGQEAAKMLEFFRLPVNLWDVYPNTFSGGERLRLNLARAMVKRPRLLLLDEPTASLDNKTKQLVKEMLLQLKNGNTSMIGIFHDLEFMDGVCDHVFSLTEGALKC
jgi:alpha-D-ribose 1-methylphosphonate 5-triphosphate synthase subunit PhnL